MDFFYEGIDYKSSLEFKLFLQRVSTVGRHLHNDFEILFVLKGNIYITVNDEEVVLTTGNIYLINPNVLHSIRSEKDNLMLVIQIPREFLIESSKNNFNIDFRYTTFNDMQTTEYKNVAKTLAEMTMLYVNKDNRNLLLKSNLYKLMYILTQHESSAMGKNTDDLSKKDLVRLLEMIEYAKESFTENKTLVEYAEAFDLTPQYFSNFFKKNYGDSYMQYINELRVEKATHYI